MASACSTASGRVGYFSDMRAHASALGTCTLGLAMLGCGADSPRPATTASPSESSGEAAITEPTSDDSQSDYVTDLAAPIPTGTSPTPANNECQRDTYEAKRAELNLLLLVDLSGSMLGKVNAETLETQWEAVRDAMHTFLESPATDGLGVSVTYYPVMEPRTACETDAMCDASTPCIDRVCMIPTLLDSPLPCLRDQDCPYEVIFEDGTRLVDSCVPPNACNNYPLQFCLVDENCPNGDTCNVDAPPIAVCPGDNSCTVTDYEVPAVPLQVLPEGRQALLQSLDESYVDPYSGTPTQVALAGAFRQLQTWRESDPTRRPVLILATDGVPEGCESLTQPDATVSALAQITQAAETGLNTFVIGVLPQIDESIPQAVDLIETQTAFLRDMATAGGTDAPFLVQADVNTAQVFLDALDAIREAALPCDYELPTDTRNFDRVNVEVATNDEVTVLPKVDNLSACDGAGWYYDSDQTAEQDTPTRVVLCPVSCESAKGSELGRVDVVLGCPTVREVR